MKSNAWPLVSKFQVPFLLLSSQVSGLYKLIPKEKLLGTSHFLNFGYWEQGMSYDQASTKLALTLSDYAGVMPQQMVLCAGCGFGEEVTLLQNHYQLKHITGINIFGPHLFHGCVEKITPNITFCQASATAIPILDGQYDRVLALESAMHFRPRSDFFKEAYRVLKPGGTLALADVVLTNHPYNWFQKIMIRLTAMMTKVPKSNLDTAQDYVAKLKAAGFSNISYQDVSKRVLIGYLTYLGKQNRDQANFPLLMKLVYLTFRKKLPIGYILIKAEK